MNTQELKELAEWAAEWLGDEYMLLEIFSSIGDCEKEWIFFEAKMYAPILAHLAKRKMEELGWQYAHHSSDNHNYSIAVRQGFTPIGEHENEYIALWLAIRKAENGG